MYTVQVLGATPVHEFYVFSNHSKRNIVFWPSDTENLSLPQRKVSLTNLKCEIYFIVSPLYPVPPDTRHGRRYAVRPADDGAAADLGTLSRNHC